MIRKELNHSQTLNNYNESNKDSELFELVNTKVLGNEVSDIPKNKPLEKEKKEDRSLKDSQINGNFDIEVYEKSLPFLIAPDSDIPDDVSVLKTLQGETICSFGNFVLLYGKAKVRKTFLVNMLIASCLSEKPIHNLENFLPMDKRDVLYFDTEQSPNHILKAVKRVCAQIGKDKPENLFTYSIKSLETQKRIEFIKKLIYSNNNLGIVVIDGIRDLVTNINDPSEATKIATYLMRWISERNISIITVLHSNKGDNNARGHLGTELINKAENVLLVTVDPNNKDISICKPEQSRNIPFKAFSYSVDHLGLPFVCSSMKSKKTKTMTINEQGKNIIEEVYQYGDSFKRGDLMKQLKLAVKKITGIDSGTDTLESVIKKLIDDKLIFQEKSRGEYFLSKEQSLDNQ